LTVVAPDYWGQRDHALIQTAYFADPVGPGG
jgi:hypothetical protein